MMKAVIVSSSYSYLERVELLKEYYEKKGYETTVLLTNFIHAQKRYEEDVKEGYVWVQTKAYNKNISVERLCSHWKFAKDVSSQLERMEVNLLHVLLPANALAKTAKKYKKRHPEVVLRLDIIDLWPETMPIRRFKSTYPFQLWRRLRDDNLDNANQIFCECDLFTKAMGKSGDPRFKTLYWVKTDEPVESNPNLIGNELHLCYLGSINNVIDIDYIVKICEEAGKLRAVVLHIIGDGEKREELLQKTKTTGAEVLYHGLIYDAKEKQAIFDKCHFGLNIMKDSVCVGLTMKSLDYFRAGLPIINNIDGDTADMIREYGIGFNGYHALLKHMMEMTEQDYLDMRQKVRALYHEKFTKEAFIKRLEENDG